MGLSINPIRKGAQVEVKLTNVNVGSTFPFPDISYLRNVQITEMEVISAAEQTTSPGGNAVIAQADLLGVTLTLAVQGVGSKRQRWRNSWSCQQSCKLSTIVCNNS